MHGIMLNKKLNHLQGKFWGVCSLLLIIGPFSCFSNFSQPREVMYRIQEGLPSGTLIGSIAEDLELDYFVSNVLSFNLGSDKTENKQYVTLDEKTGDLYTSDSKIDREKLCVDLPNGQECSLDIDVFILPQQYFQLIKVKLVVEDINDNAPRFPVEEIQVFVPENVQLNSRFAVEHSAVDPDGGIYGVQTYWLVNDYGLFTMDVEENEGGELTPFLIVTASLDRETTSEYITDMVAEDGGTPPLLGTTTLKIVITDVNDNCPRFTKSQVNVTLFSNATRGTVIAQLHASDPDVGTNAQIVYDYSQRVPKDLRTTFNLDKVSGVIKLAATLDTNTKFYKLTVLAKGSGCTPAVATVSLNIISVLLTPPTVVPRYIAPEKGGLVTLKESEPPSSPIAFFTIKNAGESEKVECRLVGDGPFRLTAYKQFTNEYLLETTDSLDFEQKQKYELIMVVETSWGFVIKTAINVKVLDENDNDPIFRESMVNLVIEENNIPNMFLTKLNATDKDSGERGYVVYLLGADAPSIFTIDRATGVLIVTTSLDREEKEKYRFTVRAVDRGSPRRETFATVVLTVLDKNDNSPRFINKDFTFFVPENFPGFGEIGAIAVSDPDSGKNGLVAMSIINGSDIFVLDTGKGILRARTPLDREHQGSYCLWIEATDGGEPALSSVAMVTVLLLDINDNPPVVLFPQSNHSYMLVLPTTLPGTPITEVYAVDKDSGMNAVIGYSIIRRRGDEPNSFDIDRHTGNITLKKTLTGRGLQSLLVKVSDHGQPEPLHSIVMVNLFVNETLGNESYIKSLLANEDEINIEDNLERAEPIRRNESCPSQPVVISLFVVCLALLFTVITLAAYICSMKSKRKKTIRNALEIGIL